MVFPEPAHLPQGVVFPKIRELSKNVTVYGLGDVAVSIVNFLLLGFYVTNFTDDKLRKRWKLQVARGRVACTRCGQPMHPSEPWALGHDDDDPTLAAVPEDRRCNRATLRHTRASLGTREEDYTDDPARGI